LTEKLQLSDFLFVMRSATREDKDLVVDILTSSFSENASINYLIPDRGDRIGRIRHLMDYSFELCLLFGKAFVSDDGKGCALVLLPARKQTTLRTILLEAKLIARAISVGNIFKALRRESLVVRHHPDYPMYHLWFVGVMPSHQKQGTGTRLLTEIIDDARRMDYPVYLETSTLSNMPWYRKFGLSVYGQIELNYNLLLLTNDARRV